MHRIPEKSVIDFGSAHVRNFRNFHTITKILIPQWLRNSNGKGSLSIGDGLKIFSVWKHLTMSVLESKRPLVVIVARYSTVYKTLGVWDSKYASILHPPLTGHVVLRMRIASFAIFDWNRRLSCKRYEIATFKRHLKTYLFARSLSWDSDPMERYVFKLPHSH